MLMFGNNEERDRMSEIITCNKWLFSRDNEPFTEVHLPHTAFTEPDVINHPQSGKVHYRIVFHVPEAWQKKIVYMHIGAAMQRSEIYVNGIYQFTHFGGYQEFFIPLADNLVYEQDNTVDILLDNTSSCDMPPGKNISSLDFCYHSGLYRDAHLIVWNPVHITMPLAVSVTAGGGVFIRTESVETNGTANVIASCDMIHEFPAARRFELPDVSRGENNVSLRLKIYAPDGSVVFEEMSENAEVRPNCTHKFTFHAKIVNANLWSPENPVRYRSEWTLYYNGIESDVLNEHFGCRTISFTKDGFYLNGKKTFLNGTNRHMEYPFVGNAVPAGGQKRDAVLIKRAGFNFVRLCHYNQSPSFLEACDKLGIMVMPAIPGWQAYHANSSFLQNAFRDCRELVRSLRNRPSVILWEVSLNEAYPPAWFNEECHRIAHEEYPGDQCFTAGDTWGFFEGYDVLFPCDHLRSKDKPLLLREYGDWAFGGGSSTSRQSRGASVQKQIVQAWNFAWTFNR